MTELYHHGILGQKWGTQNGPPYPLSGGDYSKSETTAIYKERTKKNSIYNKKHFDQVISNKKTLSTLSYDKNRTKDTDMFYAVSDTSDKMLYRSLFNKKVSLIEGDPPTYKVSINNKLSKSIKVASEDSGADAFINLYSKDRDFKNFVENRMEPLFVKEKYGFKGYREAKDSLDRIKSSDMPTEKDLRTAYRMFNYVIPSDQGHTGDVLNQRTKFFNELKSEGYSAVLDTNDAIYGKFKANSPIIMFDMSSIVDTTIQELNDIDKIEADLLMVGKKALGL